MYLQSYKFWSLTHNSQLHCSSRKARQGLYIVAYYPMVQIMYVCHCLNFKAFQPKFCFFFFMFTNVVTVVCSCVFGRPLCLHLFCFFSFMFAYHVVYVKNYMLWFCMTAALARFHFLCQSCFVVKWRLNELGTKKSYLSLKFFELSFTEVNH